MNLNDELWIFPFFYFVTSVNLYPLHLEFHEPMNYFIPNSGGGGGDILLETGDTGQGGVSRPAGFSYSWVRGGPQTWKEMGIKERESEDQVD